MRLFLVICCAAAVKAWIFDDFSVGDIFKGFYDRFRDLFKGSEKKNADRNTEKVHVTKPDSGEPTEIRSNPNLGDEIKIPRAGSENPSEGAEIYIPSNRVPVNRDDIMR